MAIMDKFLNFMKLNDEDDYLDDEDDYLDDEEDMEPVPKKFTKPKVVKEEVEYEEKPVKKAAAQPKVTPIRTVSSRKVSGNGMEVCVIRPTSVETDGREITDTLLANRTVVLNLEGIDTDIAQRIIDFASGSCYALGGNMQKISNYIFIVTPQSVDISGDLQDVFSDSFDMPINNGL